MEHRGTKALEIWSRRTTDGYNGVNITNMSSAWRNGLAFCALIHRFRPELIDFSSLKAENILENNALAFRVAEQHLGIPALLDAEDMVENDIPDRLSVLTYVSQYYQAFHAMGLVTKRVVTKTATSTTAPSQDTKNKFTTPPQPKTKTEIKTDKVLTGGRLRREVCVGCDNPVFLAERLMVGSPGQLMHRTCFRCARCSTQLTLASYYETEKRQFCCEMCPDEEPPAMPDIVDSTSLASSASSKLVHQSSVSDSESDHETDNESDSYSHDVEDVLECKDNVESTQRNTLSRSPKTTPEPPKPRTVFLSKTLQGEELDNEKSNSEEEAQEKKTNNFSQISPALFELKPKEKTVSSTRNFPSDRCSDAKGLKTDPPERLTLDTGQTHSVPAIANGAVQGSIVAQRLKLFREISDKPNLPELKEKGNNVILKEKKRSPIEEDIPIKPNLTELKGNNAILKERNSSPIEEDIPIKPNLPELKEGTDAILKEKNSSPVEEDIPINSFIENEEKEECDVISEKEYKDGLDKTDGIKTECIDQEIHDKEPENSDFEKITATLDTGTIDLNSKDEKKANEFSKEISQAKSLEDESQEAISKDESHQETQPPNLPEKPSSVKEFNPFDDEEESAQDESGVVVNQSSSTCSANVDDSATVSDSHDSGADVSAASAPLVQYPDDLNPFGSDEESETPQVRKENNVEEKAQKKPTEENAKKLIKVNLNPFDSEDDEEEENKAPEDKENVSKNLNPFWSDDEEQDDGTASLNSTPSKSKVKPPRPPPPTLARNSTPTQMYGTDGMKGSPLGKGSAKKRIIAPPPPSVKDLFPEQPPNYAPPKPPRSPALVHTGVLALSPSSPYGSVALRRKGRRAPAPPQAGTPRSGRASPSNSIADTISSDAMSVSSLSVQSPAQGQEDQDEVLSWKMQKDMKNHSNKMSGGVVDEPAPPKPARTNLPASATKSAAGGVHRTPSVSKSERGEWQRKKGPAPPRPVPQKRALKKLPMRIIQQELQDIEIKQTELERQGVLLETTIRNKTETTSNNPQEDISSGPNSGPNSIEVEDMIMQLFELVNEKNELFRRQTELMYLKREKRLEEEHVELEFQIRCLMLKPPAEKTEIDTDQEEELIARLVKLVEQRDEIINCLELDRVREAQEDESIATHMMQYQEKHIDGIENGTCLESSPKKKRTLKLPKKKKKKKKEKQEQESGAKGDADKDIDETEVGEQKKKKKKKKWLF